MPTSIGVGAETSPVVQVEGDGREQKEPEVRVRRPEGWRKEGAVEGAATVGIETGQATEVEKGAINISLAYVHVPSLLGTTSAVLTIA